MLINELKESLSCSNQIEKEKNSISEKHLKTAISRHEQYMKCLENIDKAITETAQDFLNVKSEVMLSDSNPSDTFGMVEETIAALEAKSKSLSYIQSNLPIFE